MEVYVARQPIFDKKKKIFGYELLFRDGMSNAFPDIDGEIATSRLLSSSFLSFDIDTLTGGNIAFINFTQGLLVQKVPIMFPAKKIIVEILEDVAPEADVIEACQEIIKQGYQIALDDFFYKSDLQPLVNLANIIKIDFMLTPENQLKEQVDRLKANNVVLLAEKIETYEEFEKALNMGFAYFQGYFFSKPEILKGRDIAPAKLNYLQIISELNKENVSFNNLQDIINRDISLSYKLLRYLNSAYFKRVREISSIKEAIVYLGENETKKFITLIATSELASGKPEELIRTAIIRARFCELLGENDKSCDSASEHFLVGLFSVIDAMLDNTMTNVMQQIPLSKRIKDALVNSQGNLSYYLKASCSYERGDWMELSKNVKNIDVEEDKIPGYFLEAVGWADSYSKI